MRRLKEFLGRAALTLAIAAIPACQGSRPAPLSERFDTVSEEARESVDRQLRAAFDLLNEASEVLWSSDGEAPEPSSYLELEMVDGHFFVYLGHGQGMPAIDPTLLTGHQQLQLRVWFAASASEAQSGQFRLLQLWQRGRGRPDGRVPGIDRILRTDALRQQRPRQLTLRHGTVP